MRKTVALCATLLLTIGVSFAKKDQGMKESQPIFGRYELITIDELGDTEIKAKLDTGAYTASLNAIGIEYFTKKGDDWVRFTPVIDDKPLAQQELPLVKISRIKQRVEENEDTDDIASSKRPVVEMAVCLGGFKETIEVNLTNRGHFSYPLLIGAKALRQYKALVDASRQYTSVPECQ